MTPDNRKIIPSILLGLAGFAGTFYSASFEFPPHRITIIWTLFLPMLAALSYGWRAGLIAATAGLAGLFPFWQWPTNGWSNLVNVVQYTGWFAWHGYCAETRRKREAPWNNIYIAQLLFSVFYITLQLGPYAWLFSLNPPFWQPDAATTMSSGVLAGITVKGVLNLFLQILVCDALLTLPPVRRLFDLPVSPASRYNMGIITVSAVIGITVITLYLALEAILFVGDAAAIADHIRSPRSMRMSILFAVLSVAAGVQIAQFLERRVEAQETGREIDTLFRSQFELGNTGIAFTSVEKGWLRVNPHLCQMLGYKQEELQRKTWSEMTHPDDLDLDVRQFNRMLDGDIDAYEMDKRLFRKDGSIVNIHIAVSCRRNPDQSVNFVIASIQDISRQKLVEEALRESEEHFRSIIQGSSDIIVVVARDGRVIYESPSTAEILGYASGYLIGRSPLDIVHPDDRAAIAAELQSVYSGSNDGVPSQFRGRKADGTWIDLEAIGRSQLDNPGIQGVVITARDITERKMAEALYRTIFENSGTAMLILEEDDIVSLVNAEFERLSGYSRHEVEGLLKWTDLVHPDDLGRLREYGARRLSDPSSAPAVYEFRWVSRDGTVHNALNHVSLLGGTKKRIVSGVDITEQKRAEKALRESEAMFRTLLDAAPYPVVLTDLEGRYRMVNKAFESLSGISASEAIGKTLRDLGSSVDNFWDFDLKARLLKDGRVDNGLSFVSTVDGSRKHILYSSRLVNLEGVDQILTTTVDITARKQAEDALRISEAQLRATLDNTPNVAVQWYDRHGRVVYWNPASERMFGWSAAEASGKTLDELIYAPEEAAAFLDMMEQIRMTGAYCGPYESRIRRRDGSGGVLLSTTFAIPSASGEMLYVCMDVDITESKNAEQMLRQKHEELSAAHQQLLAQDKEIRQKYDELTQSEKALKESEEKYRLLADNASDIIWSLDMNQRFTYVSPSAERLQGWASEEWKSFRLEDILTPDSFRNVQGILEEELSQAVLQGDDPPPSRTLEVEEYRKDGSTVWLEVTASLMRDRKGTPLGISGVSRDITERKRVREELSRAKALLEAAVSASPAGILIADAPDVRIRMVNQAGLLLRGEEEAILTDIPADLHPSRWQVFHPDGTPFRPEDLPLSRAVLKGERVENEIAVIRDANGQDHWVLANASPIRNAEGTVTGGVVVFPEITKLKRTEEALINSETRLRAIIDSTPDAIFIRDRENRYILINKAFPRLFNLTDERIIGKSVDDLFDESLAARIREEDDRVLDGEIVEFEAERIVHGAPRVFSLIKAPLLNHHGDIIGICGIGRDMTDRRSLEKQLFQAQKMEAIGTLAGGIAHDFNNILTAIIGYSELCIEDLPEENILRQNLRQILGAGLRARSLVGQILTFSRHGEREVGPVMLGPLIKEALKMLRASLPSTIRIAQNIPTATETIRADATQTYQVIMNLATNAADAMRETGGTLTIRTENVSVGPGDTLLSASLSPGRYVKLTVQDTGHGIDPVLMNRIFEPFFTTKPKGKGTGMGLSVVYGIMKSHGGTVVADSVPGKGTCFHVYFPTAKDKAAPGGDAQTDIPGGTEEILIVDDDQIVAEACRRILQRLGYRVTMRTSSVDALGAFRAQPMRYDLVISDVTMPDMTGPELARQILSIRSAMPIILCTGFSELLDEEKAKELGAKALLMKPMSYHELAKTVRKVLDA